MEIASIGNGYDILDLVLLSNVMGPLVFHGFKQSYELHQQHEKLHTYRVLNLGLYPIASITHAIYSICI